MPSIRTRPSHRSVLAALLFACLGGAHALAQTAPPVRPAPPSLLGQFDVHAGTVQTLTVLPEQNGGYEIPVLLGATLRTMVVHAHDVRSPNFQLFERDNLGLHVLPTPESITYRGTLLEEPNARVALSIVDGSVDALVYRAPTAPATPGEVWAVQPVRKVAPGAGQSLHLVYRASDTVQSQHTCGTDTTGITPNPNPPVGTDSTVVCEIGIEADREFWQINGSNTTATQNDVTTVMNQVDFIYDRDVDVTFSISTIIVSTTQIYTTNDPGNLLGQFGAYWAANYGNIQRDVAHLFTGRNLSGSTIGIAYLGVICGGSAYGLSQSRFSNNLNSRTGLTCHEIGHNFAAPHCNGSNPCYIMCASLGGCNSNVTLFGNASINTIQPYAQAASCLAPLPLAPLISGLTPNTVSVFEPGVVQLSGQGFTSVTSYDVQGQSFTTGFSIANDGAMNVTLPEGLQLGLSTLTVTNPLGTSNPMPFVYQATSPPKLRQTTSIPNTGGIAQFDFAGTPGNQWFMVLGLSGATTPFQGLDLLNNPLLFHSGTFPQPLGIDSFSVPVPAGLGLLILFTQVLEGDLNGNATGVSNVRAIVLQ